MVKVFPQHLNIAFANETAFPEPEAASGLPLYDTSVNVLKFTDGSGSFKPALPQHTLIGTHGPKVTIAQTGADNALSVIQPYAASAVKIQCSATGSGRGLEVVSASNTTRAAYIQSTGLADALHLKTATSQNALYVEAGSVNVANGNVIVPAGTLAVGTDILVTKITGRVGINTLDPDRELDVDGGAAFRGNHIYIQNQTAPTGKKSWGAVVSNTDGRFNIGPTSDILPSGGALTSTFQIYPGAQANTLVLGDNSRVGVGTNLPGAKLEVEQNSTGVPGLLVDNNSGIQGIAVYNNGTGVGIEVDNNTSEEAMWVKQREADSNEAIQVDHSSSRSAAIIVNNYNAANTEPVIRIGNTGSGYDIRGSNANWWVDNLGNAKFNNVATKFARGTLVNADFYTVDFSAGTVSSGTYIGDTGFTETPYVIVSNFDGGLHDPDHHHRWYWQITTLTSSQMTVTSVRANVQTYLQFYWLAIGV